MRPKTFLHTLINTFSSPAYYQQIWQARLGFSVRFFIVSYLLMTIIAAIGFFALERPQYQQQLNAALMELEKNYPADLKIEWDGKETLSSSATQPIEIAWPATVNPKQNMSPLLFGIIDTNLGKNAEVDLASLPKKSFFVATARDVFVTNNFGDWSRGKLKELPRFSKSFVITKQSLPDFITEWRKIGNAVLILLTVFYPILFMFGSSIGQILNIAFNMLLICAIGYLLRQKLSFKKLFQIGLHIAVVAQFVQLMTRYAALSFGLPLERVSAMYSLTFWIFFTVIMFQLTSADRQK